MAHFDSYIRSSFKPRNLQLLVTLDDFRHLGRAAASINVTQPAVSKALAELERGLGMKLFERTARGVHPTIYGECLIRYARTTLSELAHVRDELQGLASGSSGNIRVGVLATAALALLPAGLALLKSRYPRMRVLAREGTMETLLPELWLGNLDLIVGRLPDDRIKHGLSEKMLMEEGVRLVAGRHHPLAWRRRLRWTDLVEYPWVFPPVNTLLRGPLERAFEHHGIPIPENRIETLSVHVIRGYLQYTDAIAALSEDVSRYYESLGLLSILPLDLPRLVRPVGAVWSRQRPIAAGTQLLIDCLEDAVRAGKAARSPRTAREAVVGRADGGPIAGTQRAIPRSVRALLKRGDEEISSRND